VSERCAETLSSGAYALESRFFLAFCEIDRASIFRNRGARALSIST